MSEVDTALCAQKYVEFVLCVACCVSGTMCLNPNLLFFWLPNGDNDYSGVPILTPFETRNPSLYQFQVNCPKKGFPVLKASRAPENRPVLPLLLPAVRISDW